MGSRGERWKHTFELIQNIEYIYIPFVNMADKNVRKQIWKWTETGVNVFGKTKKSLEWIR